MKSILKRVSQIMGLTVIGALLVLPGIASARPASTILAVWEDGAVTYNGDPNFVGSCNGTCLQAALYSANGRVGTSTFTVTGMENGAVHGIRRLDFSNGGSIECRNAIVYQVGPSTEAPRFGGASVVATTGDDQPGDLVGLGKYAG